MMLAGGSYLIDWIGHAKLKKLQKDENLLKVDDKGL